LVEILVAITLITIGVLGLLGELATSLKSQHLEKTQATATHLASGQLESARALTFSTLVSESGTTAPSTYTALTPVNGVNYTQVTKLQVCSPTDSPNACTSPATGAAKTVHASVTVTWNANGSSHTTSMARNFADTSSTTISSTSNPLGSCGGGGTTLVLGHLSLSPSTVSVDSSGHPTSDVTVTLTQSGLSNTTCVPLTWSDDTGSHQLSMTANGSSYTVTVPKSSITRSGLTAAGSVSFTATVPGTQAVPTATLTILGQPSFGTCSVQVIGLGLNIITLKLLSRNSLLAATVTCTTSNLSSTDRVIATYASGSGSVNLTLTSTDGTNWSAPLPANSPMANTGLTESFSFKLTRASDSATSSKSVTVTLA
jgi:Tfp pilus assembly protein PilV